MDLLRKLSLAALPMVAMAVTSCGTTTARTVPLTQMLEKDIGAVVTICTEKTEKAPAIFGYADQTSVEQAYSGKQLDISAAKETGSGFIVVHKGERYIVTNAHVVQWASPGDNALFAYSINQTKYPLEIVGADTLFDIAVLKFRTKPGKEVETVAFRDSEARLGEPVYAIGNPLGGFPYSVSEGIVGGLNRVRGELVGTPGYIQSTATTIWGNSGGPLLDQDGAVLGINTQIHVSVHPVMGKVVHPQLNFALESQIAHRLVTEIIERGRVVRAYLGVVFTQEANPLAMAATEKSPEIALLVPGSPAAEALSGFEKKPVKAINGVPVTTLEQLFSELEKIRPGTQLRITFGPDDAERTVVTRELDNPARQRNARSFLRGMASLDANDNGGTVNIVKAQCDDSGQVNCGRRSQLRVLKDGKLSANIPAGFSLPVSIAVGGNFDDVRKAWRITRLEDLDTALRQNALFGQLMFLSTADEDADGLQVEMRRGFLATLKATIY